MMYHLYTVFIMHGAQNTNSRLDRLPLLSFVSLRLSKAAPGMSFSVRTTAAVEFGIVFSILQFCMWVIRMLMVVQPRSDVFSPPL